MMQIPIFLGVGFIETFISTQRTYWIAKNKAKAASTLVFFESILYFLILFQILDNMNRNWWIILAYCAGNAIGTYINLEKVPF